MPWDFVPGKAVITCQCPSLTFDISLVEHFFHYRVIYFYLAGIYIYIYIFLNRSIVALQSCVSFCCTTKLISYMYTYIPSLVSLPPPPPPPPPIPTHLACSRLPGLLPKAGHQIPILLFLGPQLVYIPYLLTLQSGVADD